MYIYLYYIYIFIIYVPVIPQLRSSVTLDHTYIFRPQSATRHTIRYAMRHAPSQHEPKTHIGSNIFRYRAAFVIEIGGATASEAFFGLESTYMHALPCPALYHFMHSLHGLRGLGEFDIFLPFIAFFVYILYILLFLLPSDNGQHDLQHGSLITFPKERRKPRKQKETHAPSLPPFRANFQLVYSIYLLYIV